MGWPDGYDGLITGLGWRATLFIPGPAALLLFFAGLKLIPRVHKHRVNFEEFDMFGALTMTGALLLAVYALVEAPEKGWGSQSTLTMLTMLAISAALLAAFIWVELRHKHPLVRLGILRSIPLLHANFAAAAILGSFMSFQFLVTLYLQDALKWTPFTVAMAFLPSTLPIAFLGPKIGRAFAERNRAIPIALGLAMISAGYVLLLRLTPTASYWSGLFPTMLLVGLGFAFALPAIYAQSTMNVRDSEQGLASGLVNTSFQIGGAISLAVVAGVLSHATDAEALQQALPNMRQAIIIFSGISLLGLLATIPMLVKNTVRSARAS